MKNLIKSYFIFSSVERKGILLFIILIAILLVSLFTQKHWVSKKSAFNIDTSLLIAWNEYKAIHVANDEIAINNEDNIESILFPFDPNTLDSIGFIKLGLKPKTTKLLLNWRRKGKVFYKKEEFKKLYTLSEEQYSKLAPYISINTNKSDYSQTYISDYATTYNREPDHIDINKTDSITLVRLRGIGPYFAHKILEKRNELGGFIRYEQLLEAYRFNDTTYNLLKEKLVININAIKKINLNTASELQLSKHPYIGEKTAKNILLYRDALNRFEKIEQIRQVPLMNEEIYRKIAPYLSIE